MADDPSLLISNAIFGDGAAAAVLWDRAIGLSIVGRASRFEPRFRDEVRLCTAMARCITVWRCSCPAPCGNLRRPLSVRFSTVRIYGRENRPLGASSRRRADTSGSPKSSDSPMRNVPFHAQYYATMGTCRRPGAFCARTDHGERHGPGRSLLRCCVRRRTVAACASSAILKISMASLSSTVDTRRANTRGIFFPWSRGSIRLLPGCSLSAATGHGSGRFCTALPQETAAAWCLISHAAPATSPLPVKNGSRPPLVIGIDSSKEMLFSADKYIHSQIHRSQQDICDLGIRSSSVDIITGGYALRNAPDLEAALREIARVVKPSGVAAFLEFSKGTGKIGAKVHTLLLWCWGSFWGLLLHGNPRIYGYIAESLDRFPDRSKLCAMFSGMRFY